MKIVSVDLEATPATIVIEHKRMFRSPVVKTYMFTGVGAVAFHYWVCKETGEPIYFSSNLGIALDSLKAAGLSFKASEPETAWGEVTI